MSFHEERPHDRTQLELEANQGNADAQYRLGDLDFKKNPKKAFEWYQKAAAQKHPEAQFNLAEMFMKGEGCEQSLEKAFKWYEQAALLGNTKAQNNLALMLQYGEGCEVDLEKAFEWFKQSAIQGFHKAQCNLAYMLQRGIGCLANPKEAFEWYKKAANQGNLRAQFNLAQLLEYGKGCEIDLQEALRWYTTAATNEFSNAQYYLAFMLQHGRNCEVNLKEAFVWCKKAANQGHPRAQYQLGYMLQYGEGCEINFTKAFKYYKKAALHGLPEAQEALAYMLENGLGCKRKVNEAIKWYQKAVNNDYQLPSDTKKRLLAQYHSKWFPSYEDTYLYGSMLITREPDPDLKDSPGEVGLRTKFNALPIDRPILFAEFLAKEDSPNQILSRLAIDVNDQFLHVISEAALEREKKIMGVIPVPYDIASLIGQYSAFFLPPPISPKEKFELMLKTFEMLLNNKISIDQMYLKDPEMKLDIAAKVDCLMQLANFRKLLGKNPDECNFTNAALEFMGYIESEKTKRLSLSPEAVTRSKFIEVCNTYSHFLPPGAKKFAEAIKRGDEKSKLSPPDIK